ncbi:thiol:disulfide interchange protein DsbC [Litorivivens lipolytica]|uniref:Thiol:disulfide interchange protein n=1 Tax=Litorivivens lipolytica TaxID=1524264 RepID=A0A7W4W1U0_9GAMM|nr:DsbC family protein [Litorivivens lipolytica]MBB3045862.1 thiol:disulfide interchange protein DsbC [Litorivivens lipolytica]
MFHFISRISLVCALLMTSVAWAASPAETIRQAFHKSRPDIQVENVKPSEVPGLYEVSLKEGPTVYATENGKHFLTGDLFELAPGGFVNIAERGREQMRKDRMAKVKLKDMIVFPAEGDFKGALYVFTDVDCGYCRKLHNEVPKLNKMGIEVRYLAYPRDFPRGAQSRTAPKMVSAWCAKDSQEALTKLKNGQNIATATCDNPIAEQYLLGGEMGVTGTPAIITTRGELVPGYMPAESLVRVATQGK